MSTARLDITSPQSRFASADPKGFVRNAFKPACKRAGLEGLVFHELRHAFATLAPDSKTLAMYELSVAMGH